MVQTLGAQTQTLPQRQITLEQAVEEGIRSNLDLQAAQYSIPIAEAERLTASLWYNPSLSLNATLNPFKGNWKQTNTGGPQQNDLLIFYPLDLTGKIRKRVQSAQVGIRIAEALFQDAMRLKILETRLLYIGTLLWEKLFSLSQEKEVNLKRLVQILQRRIGQRDLLPLFQVRAQLALDQTALATRQKETFLTLTRIQLALILGRAPASPLLDLATKLRDFTLEELPDKTVLTEQALRERPDLAALRLLRDKAASEHTLARAQILDNLNLNLGFTSQRFLAPNPQDSSSKTIPGANSWAGGLWVPLPLFNRNQGNIRKSDLLMGQAGRQATALELSIHQEIESIYHQLNTSRHLILEYESNQLKNAQTLRDAQQKLFSTGAYTLLEYLDSINTYHDTLAGYHTAVADYRSGMARLNAAAGREVIK